MIPEPQLTYLLELLHALGSAADDFVIAGAQAMKFVFESARATKDFDFVLDVMGLRGENVSVGRKLRELGYEVVEGSRNFQFEKPIPNSKERMRIEFMAPEEVVVKPFHAALSRLRPGAPRECKVQMHRTMHWPRARGATICS